MKFSVKVILSPFCKSQVGTSLLGLEFIWLVVGCRMQMNESIDIDIDDTIWLMTFLMTTTMIKWYWWQRWWPFDEKNLWCNSAAEHHVSFWEVAEIITVFFCILIPMTMLMVMTMITNVVISAPGQAAERGVLETASASGDWLQVVEDSGTWGVISSGGWLWLVEIVWNWLRLVGIGCWDWLGLVGGISYKSSRILGLKESYLQVGRSILWCPLKNT